MSAKILLLDIETAPKLAYVWGLWDQNISLNQIKMDWHVMSVSAKWLGDKKIFYKDVSLEVDMTNDKKVLDFIWKLLDQADIVITQNGDAFDIKKLNTRFILNGIKPPSSFRSIDTLKIAKRYFSFTSNKLEYFTNTLNKKYKKLKHSKFSGFELWRQCLAGNKSAWKEMRKYNPQDVLATEELYEMILPWDNTINFNVYHKMHGNICGCGSTEFTSNGSRYEKTGRFRRLICKLCGKPHKVPYNELSLKKRQGMLR